ncbi:MAG: TonB-dependent hemoglobin/transferrin/lactoferrin family receptor [Comamonadaceae bacterium]
MKHATSNAPAASAGSRLCASFCVVTLAGLASAEACAQTGSHEVLAALQTVVISGSRNEQFHDDLPLSMEVLNAANLEAGQIGDIRDMANGWANVSVKRAPARFTVTGAGNPTGRDGNAGFNVRGQDGNRVLMLVDGVRLPRSYINGNNAFGRDTLSLELLKQVELVRGPSSVLYGSDALAGLVNFITHEPADFLRSSDGAARTSGGRLALSSSGDDHGLTLAATLASGVDPGLQWLLTGTTTRSAGLQSMGTNDSATVDRTTPNPQADRGGSLLGKLVLRPDAAQKHVLTLEYVQKGSELELLSSRAKAPLVAASVVDESAAKKLQRERLAWHASYSAEAPWFDRLQTVLSLQNSAVQENGNTLRNDAGLRLRETSYGERALQVGVQADKTLALSAQWSQRITYGMDYARTDVTSWFDGSDPLPLAPYVPKKYFPDTRDSSVALYAQGEFSEAHWSVTPGVRLEQFSLDVLSQSGYSPPAPIPGKSLSGANVSPKLGVLYQMTPEWRWFGNYASGFRAPSGAQLNGFSENPTPSTFVTLLANPDLKPETSNSLEFGMRAKLGASRLDLAFFASNYYQLIVDKKPMGGSGVAGDPLLFQTVNIDSARIYGFEFKASVQWGAIDGVTVSTPFFYGQTRGVDKSTDLPLNSIDPAKSGVGLKLERPQWDLRLDVTHHAAKSVADLESPYLPKPVSPPRIEQLTLPAVTTLDLHAQWRVRKGLRVNLAIVNLTDQKFWHWSDVQGLAANSSAVDAYSQPGRHLNLSLVTDF